VGKAKATEDSLRYERQVVESKQKSYRRLSTQADTYERRLTDEQIKGAIALREKALAYERKITDQQFSNLEHINDEHRVYHEREHLLYDDAVEKASVALGTQLASLQVEIDRMQETMQNLMPVGRFEREHAGLIERIDTKFSTYDEKISVQEKVTVRQDATQELLDKVAVNNRWMIGVLISSGLTLLALVLHLMHVY